MTFQYLKTGNDLVSKFYRFLRPKVWINILAAFFFCAQIAADSLNQPLCHYKSAGQMQIPLKTVPAISSLII